MFHAHGDLKPFVCTFDGCTYRAKVKIDLLRHEQRRHQDNPVLKKPFACPFAPCEYRAAEKKTLRYHVTARHTQGRTRDLQCSLCPSKFYCQATLKAHIRRHLKECRFQCQSCNFSTHESTYLTLHVKRVHEGSIRFECTHPGCNFTTRYQQTWNKHRQIHETGYPAPHSLPCTFPNCSYVGNRADRLKLHLHKHHNPNRVKKFSCSLCSLTFYDKNIRDTHVRRVHTKEKPHKCNLCSYAGFSAEHLKIHSRRVHEETVDGHLFKCDSCGYSAYQLHMLQRHKRTVHTEERRFHCDAGGCSYKTDYWQHLKTHELMHEKDPQRQFPFPCAFPNCDYRRKSTAAIKLHELAHQTSKLHLTCRLCPDQHYPDAKTLRFHEFMSHRSKLHECSLCSYAARSKYSLADHKRRRHAIQRGEEQRRPYSTKPARQSRSFNIGAEQSGLAQAQSMLHKIAVVLLRKINLNIL